MQNQYPDMLRFTQIGTIVIDLTDFHIFINFLKSDERLRDFSLAFSHATSWRRGLSLKTFLINPNWLLNKTFDLTMASRYLGMLSTLYIITPTDPYASYTNIGTTTNVISIENCKKCKSFQ